MRKIKGREKNSGYLPRPCSRSNRRFFLTVL
jgi:hypothetical protein